jgi:hypothetical protein
VVSHPLSMREALGSIPSVSISLFVHASFIRAWVAVPFSTHADPNAPMCALVDNSSGAASRASAAQAQHRAAACAVCPAHPSVTAGYSSVGRASDCRSLQQSDGPWFDSGWPDFFSAATNNPTNRQSDKMRMPGVEPGSQAWEACMMPLHYMRLPSLSLPSNPKKYRRGLPKEPRRAQKHRSLRVYASPGRAQKNCLHFSICA